MATESPTVRFLYRTDQGCIGTAVWWKGAWPLGAIFAALTIGAKLSTLFMKHDLATSPFFAWPVLAANIYIVIYVFALILIAVCFYNLSAKRLRDRDRPPALAGLLPFCALVSGAAHWLYPQMDGQVPAWSVIAIDVTFVILLVWTVIELGLMPPKLAQD